LKIRLGAIADNIVTNLCAKFNYDRMRNGKVLGNRKYNNDNKNNVRSYRGPVSGPKIGWEPYVAPPNENVLERQNALIDM